MPLEIPLPLVYVGFIVSIFRLKLPNANCLNPINIIHRIMIIDQGLTSQFLCNMTKIRRPDYLSLAVGTITPVCPVVSYHTRCQMMSPRECTYTTILWATYNIIGMGTGCILLYHSFPFCSYIIDQDVCICFLFYDQDCEQ